MMEHGNDKKLVAANAIDHRERESAKQDALAATCNRNKRFGTAHCRGYGSIQGPGKFKAKSGSARLVPDLRLESLGPGLRPKEHTH